MRDLRTYKRMTSLNFSKPTGIFVYRGLNGGYGKREARIDKKKFLLGR